MIKKTDKQNLGLLSVISIGIGGMVGGGIFAVLGLASELAGGGTPVSFLIAGIVALLTGYSYARLSVAYPSKGGTVIFIDRAFGIDLFTGSINNLLWLCYIITLALYAVAFGNYALTFFPDDMQTSLIKHILISAGILLPMLLNMFSSSLIGKTESYIVTVKIIILLLVIIAGFSGVNPSHFDKANWKPAIQIIGGGMIIFVAYEGFELIANAAENVRNYKTILPKAYYISIIFVILLYMAVAYVTIGSISPQQIVASQDFALAQAAKPSLGQTGFVLVAISAVLATLSAINATLYGAARLSYVIASEGELPVFLENKIWNQPLTGLLLTAGLSSLLANSVDLSDISTMASTGFLLIFAIVNAANFKLSNTIHSSRIISGLGFLLCISALVTLIVHTTEDTPVQLWVLLAMVLISIMIEASYIFFHDKLKTYRLNHDSKSIGNGE